MATNEEHEATTLFQEVNSFLQGEDRWGDLFLVNVHLQGDSLQVEVDRDAGITLDECGELSHKLSFWLESAGHNWALEVGSPGLTRPLRVARQYAKHKGETVKVTTMQGERVEGVLCDSDDKGFTLIIRERIREEGAKRPKWQERETRYMYDEVKRVEIQLARRGKTRR